MEDVEEAAREPKSEKRSRTHMGVRVVERTHTSEVEREHREQESAKVISLSGKRKDWQGELKQLEEKGERSESEEERLKVLQFRVDKVNVMEERAEELESLEKTEEQAEQIDREIQEERERLEEKEREREEAEAEFEDQQNGLAMEKGRLRTLTEQLTVHPTDEAKEEKRRITEHLIAVDRDTVQRRKAIETLKQEESQIKSRVDERTGAFELVAAAIVASNERMVKLNSEITKADVSMEDVLEQPNLERPRPTPAKKKETAKKEETFARRKSGKLGTAAIIVGVPLAIGAGVLAVGGRFFNTFFRNLYKLSMDPGKFFNELSSKYSSAMEDPPKGKGGVRGFFSASKWLLIGDPLPKKEKKKE